ncbi:MAG: DNA gyrase inhibitor YacG [Sedimentisphaerales bacterium]|nr:DNA gyrase inhibitor YacG [Sedimentisphaerales bacterium]
MELNDHADDNLTRQSSTIPCPICRRAVAVSSQRPKFFPFCSQRCKLIDLGAWFDAAYRVPGSPDEADEGPPHPADSDPTAG